MGDATSDALMQLIFDAAEHGVGVCVKPYPGDNWVIGFIHGASGDDIAKARTLEKAIGAASIELEDRIDHMEYSAAVIDDEADADDED